MTTHSPHSRVELSLSARGLINKDVMSKSDPMCVVEEHRPVPNNPAMLEWVQIGRTETVKDELNPEWNRKIRMDYWFEVKQDMRFRLFDIDSDSKSLNEHDFLGVASCQLADIVAAPDNFLMLNIEGVGKLKNKSGTLFIRADELDEGQREVIQATIHGISLATNTTGFLSCFIGARKKPFFEIHRSTSDGGRQLVYRSEKCKHSVSDPQFPPFTITVQQLCGKPADKEKEFYIEFFNGDHNSIGETKVSLAGLLNMSQRQLPLVNMRRPSKNTAGVAHIVQFELQREYTFLDFVTSGMQIDFAVAVDFTSSNGNVRNPDSLHYINPNYPNQYEMAIDAVLSICEPYNHTKIFEASGFGALTDPGPKDSHFFPLRLNDGQFLVEGRQGVMEAYRIALNEATLHGPTNFSPTIKNYIQKADEFPRNGKRYQVLLIITDGQITDTEKTKLAIIEASLRPISIIIIGVGKADFSQMDVLDADEGLLQAEGRRAVRDIVQFVAFHKFIAGYTDTLSEQQREYVQAQLAKDVLAELPQQVTSYMRSNGIVPQQEQKQ